MCLLKLVNSRIVIFKKLLIILSLLFVGGLINSTYSQYRDPSSKKKKKKNKSKGRPLFKKKQKRLKAGGNPFSGRKQKSYRSDINLSPFASKSRKKNKQKTRKRRKGQGQISDKKRANKKPPKKTFGKNK